MAKIVSPQTDATETTIVDGEDAPDGERVGEVMAPLEDDEPAREAADPDENGDDAQEEAQQQRVLRDPGQPTQAERKR